MNHHPGLFNQANVCVNVYVDNNKASVCVNVCVGWVMLTFYPGQLVPQA